MSTVLTEQEKADKREEFLANQCRSGTSDLGQTLASYGAAWWKDVELKRGPYSSDGFTFHVNGQFIEVVTAGDTIICKLQGINPRTLTYQRRTEPGEGLTLDDCIFNRHPISYSCGWFRGELYRQPVQLLRELIDTAIGNTQSPWYVAKTYADWDLN